MKDFDVEQVKARCPRAYKKYGGPQSDKAKENKFTIIAGPCRVESPEQIAEVCERLYRLNIKTVRAGAWKPRTFPDDAPGLGYAGLQMLADAAREFKLEFVTEGMTSTQCQDITRLGGIIQIGARNMQNYDLLQAAGATGNTVVLKRHPGASLRDTLGAVEWILSGSSKSHVIVCERGVSAPHTHSAEARWLPDLAFVQAVHELLPSLPVIVDPSHGAGLHERIKGLVGAARAIGANGVMIEAHPDPRNSVSDDRQALSLDELEEVVL